jgi:hypothetical protein
LAANRIRSKSDDDGYRRGGLFGRECRWCGRGDDDVYLETDEFSRERRELVRFSLGEPRLDSDVLAFYPSKLAEPLPQSLQMRPIASSRPLV